MKKLEDFLKEADGEEDLGPEDQKDRLVNFIVQNFYKFINNPNMADNRSLLMLVGALSAVAAAGEGSQSAMQAARRLAQAAMSRTGKIKKEKM